MDTNRDLAHQSQNEDNFATFSLGWGKKRKNNGNFAQYFIYANNHFWYCCPFFATDLMHNSTGYQEARVALGYRLGQLLRFFRALQTSRVLHNSIVHAKAWTNC